MSLVLRGRVIHSGEASGRAIVSPEPISFFGGLDADSGCISEKGHPLEGQSIAGRVLVFPRGKGSTVGSYVIYRLARRGTAPVAMLLADCEPIVALGAIMADIPTLDRLDIARIGTGDLVSIIGDEVTVG